jgi:hypothetical protein
LVTANAEVSNLKSAELITLVVPLFHDKKFAKIKVLAVFPTEGRAL